MNSCPKCKATDICGHELADVWDGVAYWRCMKCGHQWHRFPKGDRRRTRLYARLADTGPIAEIIDVVSG